MRYRLMATYLGVPYHAGLGPDGNEATLFSPGPPPDELGFTAADGHWRKQVSLTDLDALWRSRRSVSTAANPAWSSTTSATGCTSSTWAAIRPRARQLGYWEIDREVFEVVVAQQEVTGLTEERVEFPLASAMFPASNARTRCPPTAQPRPGSAGPRRPALRPGRRLLACRLRIGHRADGSPAAGRCRGQVGHGPSRRAGSDTAEPGRIRPRRITSRAQPDRMSAAWHGSPEPGPGPSPAVG